MRMQCADTHMRLIGLGIDAGPFIGGGDVDAVIKHRVNGDTALEAGRRANARTLRNFTQKLEIEQACRLVGRSRRIGDADIADDAIQR